MTGFPGDKHRMLPLDGKSANRRCGPCCHLGRLCLDRRWLGTYGEGHFAESLTSFPPRVYRLAIGPGLKTAGILRPPIRMADSPETRRINRFH
jgi:hypothetical protein